VFEHSARRLGVATKVSRIICQVRDGEEIGRFGENRAFVVLTPLSGGQHRGILLCGNWLHEGEADCEDGAHQPTTFWNAVRNFSISISVPIATRIHVSSESKRRPAATPSASIRGMIS
jgi:hypothetical protein